MTPDDHTADPVRSQTARKPDASPTGDDTTAARRELLLVLVSRAERGVLNDAERTLLRPLIEAEMAEPDAVRAKAQQQYEALMERFNDLRTETQRQGYVHERARQSTTLDVAQARIDREAVIRVHELAERWENALLPDLPYAQSLRVALDGPSAAVREPETVFCSPLVTANCPGHVGPPYCDRAPSNPTTAAPLDWTPTDDLVTADAPSEPTPETPRV